MMNSLSYWSPPEAENGRIERMKTILKNTFHDDDNIIFTITKSGITENFVAYKYVETSDSFTIDPFWVIANKTDITLPPTFEQLSMTETFLFGVNVVCTDDERVYVNFNPEQIRDRKIELILDAESKPVLLGAVDGNNCRLTHAFVQMQQTVLPDVEYLNIYGRSLQHNTLHVEKIYN